MTYTDLTSAQRSAAPVRIAGVLHRAADSWAKYRLYRRTLNELAGLSRRDLADLGLHRSMLRRVAWQAAYGS